ncbi:MAG: amidohydrolase [Bacteroidales bacterium]|nr:amidohydrolase [Bacteroidales bacterium]
MRSFNFPKLILMMAILGMACDRPREKADLVVLNARVYTADPFFTVAEAFACRDGRILAVGTASDILELYKPEQRIDAGEKAVYPGFIDAHCHFMGYGVNLVTRVDLTGTGSMEEVLDVLVEYAGTYPGEWLEGRGWDQNDWPVREYPSREVLDKIFPDRPVFLVRVDGHAALVNSEALRRAGITSATSVAGGDIPLRNGKPSGILIDNAMDIIRNLIPEPGEATLIQALITAEKKCFAQGLTALTDAGLDHDVIRLIDRLHQEGQLRIRVNAMITPSAKNLEFIKKGPFRTDRLHVCALKCYADGALGSRGALLLDPYSDMPGHRGLSVCSEDSLFEVCQLALDLGFQVNTHAIGDSANRLVLKTYGRLLKEQNDNRWRIEHAQVVNPRDLPIFSKYSVIPSVQPTHATSDYSWADERLGSERIRHAYAYRQLLKQNQWLPLGTDFPVEDISPMKTYYAAVARMTPDGKPEGGFQAEEALTPEEAIRGMTVWAARAGFDEEHMGSLEPGKWADFVILDRDILSGNPYDALQTRVIATYVAGKKVYP